MSNGIGAGGAFAEKLLSTLRELQGERNQIAGGAADASTGAKKDGPSFAEHLKQGVGEVNAMSVKADRMATELAANKTGNIHETMLAATQAELAFNLMVQVRNKALEAYNEVMRMPV
jgi:flagellar hook-basal body complex protein FliE